MTIKELRHRLARLEGRQLSRFVALWFEGCSRPVLMPNSYRCALGIFNASQNPAGASAESLKRLAALKDAARIEESSGGHLFELVQALALGPAEEENQQ